MAILTAAQATKLGLPPRPLPPDVRLVDAQGRPTKEYSDWLTQQYEWLRRLRQVLTE